VALLPKKRQFFRYEGSLTTPPCSEVVNWNVFVSPVAVAAGDIEIFKKIFAMNARPLQPLHRRVLLRSYQAARESAPDRSRVNEAKSAAGPSAGTRRERNRQVRGS
jgi:Eukaryotic-type carbonic anhydrase